MTFLDKKPEPEVEFAKEIEAAEAELAKSPEPVSEPEAEAEETKAAPDNAEQSAFDAPTAEKPEPEQKAEPEADKKVPLSVLLEERRQKQALERQQQEMANYVQQMQAWAAQQQGQQPQAEEQPIDIQQDPLGAMERMAKELAQFREAQQHYAQQQYAMQQRQAYEAQIVHTTKSAVQQFKSVTPDYDDAYKYAVDSRKAELKALGIPDEALPLHLGRDEFNVAEAARQSGRNPAEIMYQFAKARGYAGPKPKTVDNAENMVERMAEKAAAATTLSTGGKAPTGTISDQDGANLQGAAFDTWFEKRFRAEKRPSGLFRT